MILFKITWIAFFVALCFRSSESHYPLYVKDYHNDQDFVRALEISADDNVLVLVTTNMLYQANERIKNDLDNGKVKEFLLRVYVENNKCPVTDDYFITEKRYPALFMVNKNYLYHRMCNDVSGVALKKWLNEVRAPRPVEPDTLTVTEAINREIAKRKAAAAGHQAEGPSRTRSKSNSLSSTANTQENWARNQQWWRNPPPAAALAERSRPSEHSISPERPWSRDLRRMREVSEPQDQRVQRARSTGQFTGQQTPQQTAGSSSNQPHPWRKMLNLNGETTWSRSPSPPPPR